jgi:hypothetical protein
MKKLMLFALVTITSTTFAAVVNEVKNPAGQLTISQANINNLSPEDADRILVASLDDLSPLSALTGYYFAVKEANGKRYGVTSSSTGFPSVEVKRKALDAIEEEKETIQIIDANGNEIAEIVAVSGETIVSPQEFAQRVRNAKQK